MSLNNVKVNHEGRSGYVEYEGHKYTIENISEGHFCIHFPDGNRHSELQGHFDVLTEFAANQEPKWAVDNKSRKYK